MQNIMMDFDSCPITNPTKEQCKGCGNYDGCPDRHDEGVGAVGWLIVIVAMIIVAGVILYV